MTGDRGDRRPAGTDVLVVGAGPAGLMLAGELRLGGARVTVLERLAAATDESRASVLHARTMELLHVRGLLGRLGPPPNVGPGHFGGLRLDLAAAGGSPFAGLWKAPQTLVEKVLGEWAAGLGATVLRGHSVTGLDDGPDGVRVEARGPDGAVRAFRAAYAVGCDGMRSTVRDLAGFAFPGEDAGRELLRVDLTDIDIADRRFERHPHGVANARRGPDGITRLMLHAYGTDPGARVRPPDLAEVCALWARITGEDITAGRALWIDAFDDACRQVARYREGRVLLAGDAAHVQLPVGGQALNLALQEAVALGGRLAAVATGRAGESLLDAYDAECHPAAARVLGNIRAQTLLLFGPPGLDSLRQLVGELLELPAARRHLAAMVSGLDRTRQAGTDTGAATPARTTDHTKRRRSIIMGKLSGKAALVTGSSRGIGRATAIRLAREGALVAVHCSQHLEAAEDTVATIEKEGGRAFAVQAELGVAGDVHTLFLALEQGLKERTGSTTLDILVNNAGVMGGVAPEDLTPAAFDRLIAVNAKAPYFIVQRALSLIPDGGRIINISSGLTRVANPQEIAYAMTKGAVDQLTLHFAKHLGPRRITVNSVGPGITDNGSAIFDNPEAVEQMSSYSVFGRVGDASDVGDVVAFLAGPDGRWITGSYLDASGGTLLG
ncbi:SDR family oxidoreductase [Streptomyces sp. MB09-01]|nr:SDR family oxidoreductase [Streptomyces sp. MB09-01]MDX3538442.1 SDR family oxidoreductase [Streptomyces sp. MB09-01]